MSYQMIVAEHSQVSEARGTVRWATASPWIEWTAYGAFAPLKHMCMNHGGADIFVSQEFLHRAADIVAVFKQMRRKTVA